jgi:hypothetical protein
MSAFERRVAEGEGRRDCEAVARQFVSTAQRHREKLADDNFDRNEEGGGEENAATCPGTVPAQSPH